MSSNTPLTGATLELRANMIQSAEEATEHASTATVNASVASTIKAASFEIVDSVEAQGANIGESQEIAPTVHAEEADQPSAFVQTRELLRILLLQDEAYRLRALATTGQLQEGGEDAATGAHTINAPKQDGGSHTIEGVPVDPGAHSVIPGELTPDLRTIPGLAEPELAVPGLRDIPNAPSIPGGRDLNPSEIPEGVRDIPSFSPSHGEHVITPGSDTGLRTLDPVQQPGIRNIPGVTSNGDPRDIGGTEGAEPGGRDISGPTIPRDSRDIPNGGFPMTSSTPVATEPGLRVIPPGAEDGPGLRDIPLSPDLDPGLRPIPNDEMPTPGSRVITPGEEHPGQRLIPPGADLPGDRIMPPGNFEPGERIIPPGDLEPGERIIPPSLADEPGQRIIPPGADEPGTRVIPPGFEDPGTRDIPPGSLEPGSRPIDGNEPPTDSRPINPDDEYDPTIEGIPTIWDLIIELGQDWPDLMRPLFKSLKAPDYESAIGTEEIEAFKQEIARLNAPPPARSGDPIALDLNHDGVIGTTGTTTAINGNRAGGEATVDFDLDGNGSTERIEWLDGQGDAFLVDDRDGSVSAAAAGDGRIDGTQLFGDEGGTYANGYEKLAKLDANGDGKLTQNELDGLKAWIDDGDGIVEEGELKTMSELQITQLSAELQPILSDDGLLMRSTFLQDGTFHMSEDVWLGIEGAGAANNAMNRTLESLETYDQVASLFSQMGTPEEAAQRLNGAASDAAIANIENIIQEAEANGTNVKVTAIGSRGLQNSEVSRLVDRLDERIKELNDIFENLVNAQESNSSMSKEVLNKITAAMYVA
jgi:hypothetical protein